MNPNLVCLSFLTFLIPLDLSEGIGLIIITPVVIKTSRRIVLMKFILKCAFSLCSLFESLFSTDNLWPSLLLIYRELLWELRLEVSADVEREIGGIFRCLRWPKYSSRSLYLCSSFNHTANGTINNMRFAQNETPQKRHTIYVSKYS